MSHDEFVMNLVMLGFVADDTSNGSVTRYEHPTYKDGTHEVYVNTRTREADNLEWGHYQPYRFSLAVIIKQLNGEER